MKTVKSIVLAGNGINCETEMAHACRLAGSDQVDIVYLYDLLSGEAKLDGYHFLAFPGGFLDGDDLGSAKAMAHRMKHAAIAGSGEKLQEAIRRFIRDGKLIIGVCNGFQLLVKAGWLPALDGNYGRQEATLTFNDSGRFEDRWVYLKVNSQSPCVFTKGLEKLYFPVRHGEGKFIPQDEAVLKRILSQKSVRPPVRQGGLLPLPPWNIPTTRTAPRPPSPGFAMKPGGCSGSCLIRKRIFTASTIPAGPGKKYRTKAWGWPSSATPSSTSAKIFDHGRFFSDGRHFSAETAEAAQGFPSSPALRGYRSISSRRTTRISLTAREAGEFAPAIVMWSPGTLPDSGGEVGL